MADIINLDNIRMKKQLFEDKREEREYNATLDEYGFSPITAEFMKDTFEILLDYRYDLREMDLENVIFLGMLFQDIINETDGKTSNRENLLLLIREKLLNE